MSIKWRNAVTVLCFLFVFFVIGSLANVTWNEPLSLTGTMVFSSICIMWTISIGSRITKRSEKRYFILLGMLMLLFMVIRAVKFSRFLNNEWLERHLWYGYYIPMILMPLLSLMISLCLGKTDEEKLNPKSKLLYIPAALLIVGVITNDFHQLAFRFKPNFDNWRYDYSYGILYYLVFVWIIACVLTALIITVRFSTVNASKRKAFIPLAVITVSLVGVGIYIFTDFKQTRIMNVAELFCFCVAAYWEACLLTGLIPSNTGYDLLFKNSHLSATITDLSGDVIYKTAVQKGDGAYIRHEQSISGGKITWLEDITAVEAQKRKLEVANAELEKKAEIRQKENAIKEEKTKLEEQKKLYDKMNATLVTQTEHIRRLVSEAEADEARWSENMMWVCVIGAYIKRKSNLMLLAAKSDTIPMSELFLAYRESLSYLERAGVSCEICTLPDIDFPSGLLLYAYDEFETVIESKMPDISRIKMNITEKDTSVLFDIKADETPLLFELEKGVKK
ncbi:MAG: hypothetical protein IKF64_03695 [Eubacterium sp.]|nr:hypothetical protein [Eubacterium sp.]